MPAGSGRDCGVEADGIAAESDTVAELVAAAPPSAGLSFWQLAKRKLMPMNIAAVLTIVPGFCLGVALLAFVIVASLLDGVIPALPM
ncbi:MAG: hypothetical protein HYZ29_08555 [Myxococcales bacterium]|nr:hypothetical protein [Myxococcales bacterium]